MKKKTSLQASHSVWSNLKLTLLSLITTVAVSGVWASVALIGVLSTPVVVTILTLSVTVSAIGIRLFSKFTR